MDELEQYLMGDTATAAKPTTQPSATTAPLRANNPGALMPGGKLAQYKTPEEGLSAIDDNLKNYGKKGAKTLTDVITKWAPPNENDTKSYIAHVAKVSGLDPNQEIDLNNPLVRHQISAGIVQHENGTKALYAKQSSAQPQQQTGDELENYLSNTSTAPVSAAPTTTAPVAQPKQKTSAIADIQQGFQQKQQQQQKYSEDALARFGQGAASLADVTIGGIIPSVAGAVTYAGQRFLGHTPEEAQATQQKVEQATGQPFGKAFGVTETPGYKQEAGRQTMEFIGENVAKGAKWIAEKTGLPQADVENMMGTLTAAVAPEAAQKGAGAVKQITKQFVEKTPETFVGTAKTPPTAAAESRFATPAEVQKMQDIFAQKQAEAQLPTNLGGSVGARQVDAQTARVANAQSLPVPITLSKDQITRAPADVNFARETAKNPVLGQQLQEHYANQNAAIQKNLDHLVETTGAELTGVNPGDLGKKLADLYTTEKPKRYQEVSNAYLEARVNGEMNEPIDISPLKKYVDEHQAEAINAPVIKSLEVKLNNLTKSGDELPLNDIEEVRKMVGNLSQDSASNAHFGREIRGLIDKITENKGGDLYKKARKLNEDYMTEFEDTPVIRDINAMKSGTTQRVVAMENLVNKSIVNGSLDDVKQLFGSLEKMGPEGEQMIRELKGVMAQRIKDEATKGVQRDINGKPYVSTHALNKEIVNLDKSGKLDYLFGSKNADHYRTLNDVTKDVQTIPKDTTNTSGTAANLLAALTEMGVTGMTTGIPVPVATIGKIGVNKIQTARKLNKIKDFIQYGENKVKGKTEEPPRVELSGMANP